MVRGRGKEGKWKRGGALAGRRVHGQSPTRQWMGHVLASWPCLKEFTWAAVPATSGELRGRLGCQASGSGHLAAQAAAWLAGVRFKQPK